MNLDSTQYGRQAGRALVVNLRLIQRRRFGQRGTGKRGSQQNRDADVGGVWALSADTDSML